MLVLGSILRQRITGADFVEKILLEFSSSKKAKTAPFGAPKLKSNGSWRLPRPRVAR